MLRGSTGNGAQFLRRNALKPCSLCSSCPSKYFDPVTVPVPPRKERLRPTPIPFPIFRGWIRLLCLEEVYLIQVNITAEDPDYLEPLFIRLELMQMDQAFA